MSSNKSELSLKPAIKIKQPKVDQEISDDDKKSLNSPQSQTFGALFVPGGLSRVLGDSRVTQAGDIAQHRGASICSIHSASHTHPKNSKISSFAKEGRRVRFFDRISWKSISAIQMPHSDLSFLPNNEEGGDYVLQWNLLEDPNYLPGFTNLFYSSQITILESSCCYCNISATYEVKDGKKTLYHMEKEGNEASAACAKWFFFRNCSSMRVGFVIDIYSSTISTELVTFNRRTHWFANQLDIVETFYSLEHNHVGRIEKTVDGYRIINNRGDETYRIRRDEDETRTLTTVIRTLLVVKTETCELAATIICQRRNCFSSICPILFRRLKHTIKWEPGTEVTSKILLIGVLMMEINSNENFQDLPLGSDAVIIT